MERTFKIDGIDETSHDCCQLFTYENNHQVDKDIHFIPDFAMGREASAANFIESLEGKTEPLNTPEEAVQLMRIVDAMYESAKTGLPVIMERKENE
jgi:predicted dehydrogenase